MEKHSAFLTFEELQLQMELSNILYNGTGPEPIYATASIEKQKKYRKATGEEEQRETALEWIDVMTNLEFQTRLTKGTLPDFIRQDCNLVPEDTPEIPHLVRLTNHPSCFLSEQALRSGCENAGYINRNELRYYSIEEFKKDYYMQ